MKSIISIIFAKEEIATFNRCTFPILSRPTFTYPLMASLNSKYITKTFLSTNSDLIKQESKVFEEVEVLGRNKNATSPVEEFICSISDALATFEEAPEYVAILLGNSPCILSDTIDNMIEILDKKNDTDSIVTVEKRHEFNPKNAYSLGENGFLSKLEVSADSIYDCFVDGRIVVTRLSTIKALTPPYENYNFSSFYGKKIYPCFQEEGISDIDYPWQVPTVERWLKKNRFTETQTPYKPKTARGKSKEKSAHIKSNNKTKVFITTIPFGEINRYPIDILEAEEKCEFTINPIGRKLKENEIAAVVQDYDVIIAGTEAWSSKVMTKTPKCKLISRVGIGLDSVDLLYARANGIKVSYTPDAPAPAVAELTLGHMLNLSRSISLVDRKLRDGIWQRIMGRRITNQTIGIIGTGRVGSRVLKHLQGFSPKKILVNDLAPDYPLYDLCHAEHVDKETIYSECDIISLHVPLTPATNNLITEKELDMMKPEAFLINTARGGMVNEKNLYEALSNNKIAGAAVDVFVDEPYGGELVTLDNCFMTCHMGSCSSDCRYEMEKLATEEALRFIRGEELLLEVPEYEYELKEMR